MKNKIFRRELFNAIMVLLFGVLMVILYHAFHYELANVYLLIFYAVCSIVFTIGTGWILMLLVCYGVHLRIKRRLEQKSPSCKIEVLYCSITSLKRKCYFYFCSENELKKIREMFRTSVQLPDVIERQTYFREINYFIAKNARG